MAYTSKLLYNESSINDAYYAVLSHLKKRSETPKKQPQPLSIWGLESDSECFEDRKNNCRLEEKDKYNSKYSSTEEDKSYGKVSFYEEGDEAIWGNLSDVKYPSIKSSVNSYDLKNHSITEKASSNKPINSFKYLGANEKLRYENRCSVKNTWEPKDLSSLRQEYRNQIFVTDSVMTVNVSKRTSGTRIQNSAVEYNYDVKMDTSSSENMQFEVSNDDESEGRDLVRSKNKSITPEKNGPRKRPCISDISSFDPHPKKAIHNLLDKFSSTDNKENVLNEKFPNIDQNPSFKSIEIKEMIVEHVSKDVHNVPKEISDFKSNQQMSSEIKSLLNISSSTEEVKKLPTKELSFLQDSVVYPKSLTPEKTSIEVSEDNWRNCWRTPSKLAKNEQSRSPTYVDWLKQREDNWKQKNSDILTDSRNSHQLTSIKKHKYDIGKKNSAYTIENLVEKNELGKENGSACSRNSAFDIQEELKNVSAAERNPAPLMKDNRFKTRNESTISKNVVSVTEDKIPKVSTTKEDSFSEKIKDSAIVKNHGEGKLKKENVARKNVEASKRVKKSVGHIDNEVCAENKMISLLVTDGDKTSDLTVENGMLERVKAKRPEIKKLIPMINSKTEEIPYSSEAVMSLLRCLFSSSPKISCWKVALEVLALSIKYNVKRLVKISEIYFTENPLTLKNVEEIIHNACYLKVLHKLNNIVKIQGLTLYQFLSNTSLSSEFHLVSCSCTISTKLLVESSEFCLPLCPVKHDFSAAFKKDVRNVLTFEAIEGTYILTGIQIKFDVNSLDTVNIEYRVSKGSQMVVSDEKEKRLRSLMILNFGKDVLIQPREKAEVSIMIEDIQPRICSGTSDSRFDQNSNGCRFAVTLSSNVSPRLVFIEKLFYTVSL